MATDIVVELRGGRLRLKDGKWQAEGGVSRGALEAAEDVTGSYQYSPAHGYPGYHLAQLVAEATGGEAILPPVPPMPEGAIP